MTNNTQHTPGPWNLYRDDHTGGWVVEWREADSRFGFGRWFRLGIYGSRNAARAAIAKAEGR